MLTFVSNDTTVNALSFVSGTQLNLLDTYVDDVFYKAEPNLNNGRYTTNLMSDPTSALIGKYAYVIVLDLPYASFTSIAALPKDGSISAGISAMGWEGLDPVTPIKSSEFVTQAFDGGAVVTNLQVIPEPTGAALALAGLGVLIYRRMKARNF